MNKEKHEFIRSVRIYLHKDLMNELGILKDYNIPLSHFISYLIKEKLDQNREELDELLISLQKTLPKSKRKR